MTWKPPALIFPDIELLLAQRIRAALASRPEPYAQSVFVGATAPNPLRDRVVTVRRDGGQTSATRDQPRVGINVWATDEREANDLSRLIAAILRDLPDGNPVLAVPYVTGASTVPDESTKYRRYLTAEIHTRGAPL